MGIVFALVLAGSGISIDVEPGCACLTGDRLTQRLGSIASSIRLQVRKAPGAVLLEALFPDGRRMTREVPAPLNECPAVEETVVLLVVTWSRDRNFLPPQSAERVVVPDAGRPAVATRKSPVLPKTLAPALSGPDEAPQAILMAAPGPVETVDARTSAIPEAPDAGRADASNWPGVQLVVRGGVTARTPPPVLPAAELALSVTWGGLGFALSGGVSDATRSAVGPGGISSSAAWGSLGAAGALALSSRISLEASVGVRVLALSVASSGFSQSGAATLVSAGAFLEGGMSCRVAGPLILGLWGAMAVRPGEERLVVGNVEGGVTVPRWQFTLFAGAGVQWR
jgi:hypothetical protein